MTVDPVIVGLVFVDLVCICANFTRSRLRVQLTIIFISIQSYRGNMEVTLHKKLDQLEIQQLSSEYLDTGIKKESWEITEVDIDGPVLLAKLRMTSTCASETDEIGFHLTIFSTMEFLSQLANIYFHVCTSRAW